MSTVGYGDVYCQTILGRTFLVFFLLVGLVSISRRRAIIIRKNVTSMRSYVLKALKIYSSSCIHSISWHCIWKNGTKRCTALRLYFSFTVKSYCLRFFVGTWNGKMFFCRFFVLYNRSQAMCILFFLRWKKESVTIINIRVSMLVRFDIKIFRIN